MRTITTEEFIRRAKLVHGDKYDYEKVMYVNMHTDVCIICPVHGEFWQQAQAHVKGCGCSSCAQSTSENKLICGVGLNDYGKGITKNDDIKLSYKTWLNMLKRCYKQTENEKTYLDCSVTEEWTTFSNFSKWFYDPKNGYREGYQLDKDILVKGNKIYSPDTCCFVPHELNMLLVKRNAKRGKYPIGVGKLSKSKRYESRMSRKTCGTRRIGIFNTSEEAFYAYKRAKEKYVKEVADDYYNKGLITKRVHDALYRYEVEITD